MTNTKCTIDCAKYNVKWSIEFWRKWNAIEIFRNQSITMHFHLTTRYVILKYVKNICKHFTLFFIKENTATPISM